MNTAVILYLLLLLSGAICLGIGIYILWGMGWMLLVIAFGLFGFASFLRKGLIDENTSTNPE
ncbi:hypothetical protein B9T31_09540 [Acinetobacter sp. ANC 4558]|uniref:hypothetical protein n=1 Tax=Acinetobacter sp. ANC 4558 TaxID=1977876 RepID=UPI000A32F427|nr:hypothetical protein [Acinetobacter sp. ANC 4558]OTG85828.1 hypothetical protein B9T31_09540 [Acinetobacter sp. ANC 4558]